MSDEKAFDGTVGSPEEWVAFAQRNRAFCSGKELIEQAASEILDRTIVQASAVDQCVFMSASQVVDDFSAMVILAANGEGFAAIKLVRPMSELAVTLKYVAVHPEVHDAYVAFGHVDRRRIANSRANRLPESNRRAHDATTRGVVSGCPCEV